MKAAIDERVPVESDILTLVVSVTNCRGVASQKSSEKRVGATSTRWCWRCWLVVRHEANLVPPHRLGEK